MGSKLNRTTLGLVVVASLALSPAGAADNATQVAQPTVRVKTAVTDAASPSEARSERRDQAASSDDAGITAKVKAALGADVRLNAYKIEVKTSRGVVSLGGTVRTVAEKQAAEQLTADVAGVVRVDNRIQLSPG